ncbi:MAG: 4-hydroxythreonine-4-phosphate dehydrogenase PdxA, partial [Bdellovibrionota bacterium]
MSPSPKSPPRLGLTMGDPQGIGPEILVRAVAGWKGKPFVPVALGDAGVLGEAAERFAKGLEVVPIGFSELPSKPVRKKLYCISLSDIPFSEIKKGEPGKKFGKEVHDYLLAGINLALEKKIAGLVTAPIAKSAFAAAGISAKGHTEILAERSGVSRRHAMMLAGPRLRVTLATVHVPLRQVPEVLTKEKIVLAATLTHEWLKKYFGVKKPKIAVAGLNPHAGEAGLLGSE